MNALDARKQIQLILGLKEDGGQITLATFEMAHGLAAKAAQQVLHTQEDGVIGKNSVSALIHLNATPDTDQWPSLAHDHDTNVHHAKGSSFADPADITAFVRCKNNGGSDQTCFKVGDNGIGKWGDNCKAGSGPKCALPPEYWAKFGAAARHKLVRVTLLGKDGTASAQVICKNDDTMPHLANIKNGAGIDLNYDAWIALGHTPPQMRDVSWEWVEDVA